MSEPSSPNPVTFRLGGVSLVAVVGYLIKGEQVEMFATLVPGVGSPVAWRHFFTPKSSALDEAAQLCADVEEYVIGELGIKVRDVEDLDFDDFLEHLELNINHAFH